MKKRIISIILTLCMVLTFVPTTVFAAEGITPETPQKDGNGVYQIGTAAELYGFAELVNGGDTSASAVLTADIVVNKGVLNSNGELNSGTFTYWTPIGNDSNGYTGKFYGQGHTISGLYFNDENTNYVGLFGYLGTDGEIKNVGVIDSYFNGQYYVGGVCGENYYGTITACYNTGKVSGNEAVGGVCGWNERGTITGCYNTGTVSSTYNIVGGVCGYNGDGSIITGCYNTGTVSGSNYVGGVCGWNEIGTITGCYNTGIVSGTNSGTICVGGVCGYNGSGSTITGCYNTGTVSGNEAVGGVCGENYYGTITGCYNTGEVSGSNYVGGVCGYNIENGTITGCYANNKGICGFNNGTVTDCGVKSDEEFKNGTVCGLLNTALKNANSDVCFCQRIGTDVSPLLTYQFESIDEHTYGVYTVDVNKNTFKATCLCGTKTAKTMELTLNAEKTVVANGEENTLTATLSNLDNETVTYKWYQNDALIENATTNTYKMPTGLPFGTYTYKVDVTIENAGTITKSVSVFVDNDPPTGEISVGTISWKTFLNNITFGMFFKDTQTVKITASDNSGDAVKIEYLLSDKELSETELDSVTFTAYTKEFSISTGNKYVIYAKLTDASGNVAYLSSEGIVLDATAPVISGIENGKTYCEAQTVTVTEDYIKSVTVNGTAVSLDANNQFTLNPTNGTQTIVVTDKAGNETSVTVKVNDGHTDTNKDHNCDFCNANVGTHADINKDHKCDYGCSEAIGTHEDTNSDHKCDYGCSEAIGTHEDTNSDHNCDYCNEKITTCLDDDKDHICDICATTLSEHTGGTATCVAKAICEYCAKEYGELDSANHNLEKIPTKDATVTETGNKEYWHCKDCGKYFADENGTNEIKLDDTVTQKLSPEIIEGKGQSITAGEKKEITLRSNAAFGDFIRVELDGKTLDEKYYTVKEGSTIVTLKADYVATLSAGEHTLGIVSESGTATTTFTVNAKAVDNNVKPPKTGNDSNTAIWLAVLLALGGTGMITTSVYSKKRIK